MAKSKTTKNVAKSGLSSIDKILETAGWFSLIALGLLTIFTYFRSPDIIPLHFNALGHVDGHGKKAMIFAVFAIAAAIFLSITFSIKYVFSPPNAGALPNKNLDFAIRIIHFVKLFVMLEFIYILVMTNLIVDGLAKELGSMFLPIVMISLLFPIAYYFKRTFSSRIRKK
ncbi:DUF1648 domain-containing protein [Dyadobacter subterraneus]|uniref:DUF1648 domain-containing protein n=1 Tax=Dyadobacter subterraneus TaxID=2773304 RepID=A0ABR9WGL5_9BACT|nr:DUF1648 domain-containing protein [Dyadobacter subterraneus]MBE9464538.1 DUF1648 domain-containing protein [Dyadobacter subterraneus]